MKSYFFFKTISVSKKQMVNMFSKIIYLIEQYLTPVGQVQVKGPAPRQVPS